MQRDLSKYRAFMSGLARDICDVIGVKETLILIEQYGGRIIQISKMPGTVTQERIACHLGHDAAKRLGFFFEGRPFTVPMCSKAVRAKRNDDVRSEFDRLTVIEKMSSRAAVAHIVRNTSPSIHERTVWRILNNASG